MSRLVKDLFLDCLTSNGLFLDDIEVVLAAGHEVTWEEFAKSETGMSQITDSQVEDIVLIGQNIWWGSWWLEFADFENPTLRAVKFFSDTDLQYRELGC